MHTRTKACSISAAVKKRVEERDGHVCIFCGHPGRGEAHVVPRSHGGLGVEQNLITVCRSCHYLLDDTVSRPLYLDLALRHLRSFYPDWQKEDVIYQKGIKTKHFKNWENKNLVNNTKSYTEKESMQEKTKHDGFYFLGGNNENN